MFTSTTYGIAVALGFSIVAGAAAGAQAQARRTQRDRPLTINRHTGGPARGTGIEVRDHGNEIVAWGGLSANGYGYGPAGSEAARRAARNESVRNRTAGLYGYGFDGLGGTFGNGDGRFGGYDNPFYGNAYSSYVGDNGVPSAFAFGPAFANRHITDSDDDDARDVAPQSPGELGYSPLRAAIESDD